MVSRAVAWGAAPGIESDTLSLGQNARTTEGLAVMKPWAAIATVLPPAIKLQLRGFGADRGKEHHLVEDSAGRRFIEIGQKHPAVVADPKKPDSCDIVVKPYFADDASWGVRIRALSAVSDSPAGSTIDLLQLDNASAITRVNKCTGARAPSEPGGSMTATVSSAPPPGGPATALKLQYTASTIPAKSGVRDIGCVDNSFAVPLNLSTHRVMELELWSDCDSTYGCEWGYLGVQLQAGGGFRDFIVRLNFSGWRTVRLDVPATRGMYTTDFPKPGNENMASRGFGWSGVSMLSFYVSNFSFPTRTFYVGKLVALQETAAFAGENAALRIGKHTIRLPPKLQGKPCVVGHVGHTPAEPGFPSGKPTVLGCADYVECRDVGNASSCRAFDANNNPLLTAIGHSYGTDMSDAHTPLLPAVPVVYTAAQAAARVQVTVFEWSNQRLGPFSASQEPNSRLKSDDNMTLKLKPAPDTDHPLEY